MAREIRLKTIERPDGKARIFIIARDDGLFRYVGEVEDHDEFAGTFWRPCDMSGLYETPEAAEADARNEVPWLKRLK
jgi:hypothetical protein